MHDTSNSVFEEKETFFECGNTFFIHHLNIGNDSEAGATSS